MENMGQDRNVERYGPTPIDDIFKLECNNYPELLPAVLREIFPGIPGIGDAQIEILGNEHPAEAVEDGEEKISRRYSDCVLRISGRPYHLEAQSAPDGSILLRLTEYDLRIAMERAEYDRRGRCLSLEIPVSGVLYFHGTGKRRKKLDHMRVRMLRDGKELAEYEVPMLRVQAYDIKELFEKELYFLLPFYALRFESRAKRIAKEEDRAIAGKELGRIIEELDAIGIGLAQAVEEGRLEENGFRGLITYCKHLIGYIGRNMKDDLKKGMVEAMGGRVLEFNSEYDIFMGNALEETARKLRKTYLQLQEAQKEAEEKNRQVEEKNRQVDRLEKEITRMKEAMEKAGIKYPNP